MQRILSFLLLLFLPLAAMADGMVIPTIAYPAKITIPDQRALICFSNGTERLVIETRFTGSGTNFAWVVPLPSQPVVEEATTGLFPTLEYLFRPQIIHEVPRYYVGILIALGIIYLIRFLVRLATKSIKSVQSGFIIGFVLGVLAMILTALFLPALATAKSRGMASVSSEQAISILDRKIVGIFETTTIASQDVKALQTWLSANGYAMPANSEPVIASYVKDNWVFVATKVRRDKPDNETSTPHPLSFTFKTDKPVYPMRLTGLGNGSLSVELYVFGSSRAKAAHFKVESCTQLNHPPIPASWPRRLGYWQGRYLRHSSTETLNIVHPLLRQWAGDSAVATKLTAILSPADMRKDIWIDWTSFLRKENRLFSRQGAATHALNWGAGIFAAGLFAVCLFVFANKSWKSKLPLLIGIVTACSIIFAGLVYLSLPKIEVKLVRGFFYSYSRQEQFALAMVLGDGEWRNIAEARAEIQNNIINLTNKAGYGLENLDNQIIGGQIREEDSPGNYLLRETNNQLQLIAFNPNGGEEIISTWDLPHKQ